MVLYGRGTWSVTLREEQKLYTVFGHRIDPLLQLHAMKVFVGGKITPHVFLTRNGGEFQLHAPASLAPGKDSSRYPWNSKLGGPRDEETDGEKCKTRSFAICTPLIRHTRSSSEVNILFSSSRNCLLLRNPMFHYRHIRSYR